MPDPYITINKQMFEDLVDTFPPRLQVQSRILWMHILWNANYGDTDTLERGQMLSGRKAMAKATGLPEQTVRTILDRLKVTNQVTNRFNKVTNRPPVLTIVNYDGWTVVKNKVTNRPEKSNQPTNHISSTTSQQQDQCLYSKNQNIDMSSNDDPEIIFQAFLQHINPKAKLTKSAMSKIRTRLKVFTPEELIASMVNIAKDAFFQEHNAARPAAWFFHSDERIEMYLNKVPKGPESATADNQCPGCKGLLAQKTYPVGNPRVPPQMQGVPIWECGRCGFKRKVEGNGINRQGHSGGSGSGQAVPVEQVVNWPR